MCCSRSSRHAVHCSNVIYAAPAHLLQKSELWSVHSKDCSDGDQTHTLPGPWLLPSQRIAWVWCIALAWTMQAKRMQSLICQAAAWHVNCMPSSSDLLLSLTLYSRTCARSGLASLKAAS